MKASKLNSTRRFFFFLSCSLFSFWEVLSDYCCVFGRLFAIYTDNVSHFSKQMAYDDAVYLLGTFFFSCVVIFPFFSKNSFCLFEILFCCKPLHKKKKIDVKTYLFFCCQNSLYEMTNAVMCVHVHICRVQAFKQQAAQQNPTNAIGLFRLILNQIENC